MMASSDFPHAVWNGSEAHFLPFVSALPAGVAVYAALVFAFSGDRCAIAEIDGRGWCIPGGRLEPGETPETAIRREAHEEAGLTLGPLSPIGYYRLLAPEDRYGRFVPVFIAAILSQHALPEGTESHGVRLAALEELPAFYYLWDPLIAAVCRYAFARWFALSK